ncbi:MAG: VWA domain-containing protein [Vicinamibacterales bacterium]
MAAPWLIIPAVILALPSYAMTLGAQNPPTFRSAVDVVSVTAVVKDRKGRFVRDLGQDDFVVAEGAQQKRIIDFRAETDGPVKLGLLVDASGSMRVGQRAVDARGAARHLFAALRDTDEAALFSFDTRLDRVSAFTSDTASLDQALDRLNPPFGQTSLYDAIGEAATFVAEQGRGGGRLPQRAALVVLTDGIDTHSRNTTEQVAALASRIDVPVYIIAVMLPIDDPRTDVTPDFDVTGLQQLARSTGGEMFTASAPAHASVAARQILGELRHQYVLAFEASTRPGWRPISVQTRDDKFSVRARTGYSAGGSSRPAPGHGPGASFESHAAFPAAACGTL